jgi:hypothetical protein
MKRKINSIRYAGWAAVVLCITSLVAAQTVDYETPCARVPGCIESGSTFRECALRTR